MAATTPTAMGKARSGWRKDCGNWVELTATLALDC